VIKGGQECDQKGTQNVIKKGVILGVGLDTPNMSNLGGVQIWGCPETPGTPKSMVLDHFLITFRGGF
jgi:hypothetical protein